MRNRQRGNDRQARGGSSYVAWSPPALTTYARTNVLAAYGTARIFSGYTGYCMKVRRVSDDATLVVGFGLDGNVDTDSLTSFKGASSLKLDTWYDQSGNGSDISQATKANQPAVTISNSSFNNKPTVDFSSAGSTYISTATLSSVAQPLSIVSSSSNTRANAIMVDSSPAGAGVASRLSFQDVSTGGAPRDPVFWCGGSILYGADAGSGPYVVCGVGNGASGAFYVNDPATPVATGNAGSGPYTGVTMGRYYNTGTNYMDGSFRAMFITHEAISAGNITSVMNALKTDIGL